MRDFVSDVSDVCEETQKAERTEIIMKDFFPANWKKTA